MNFSSTRRALLRSIATLVLSAPTSSFVRSRERHTHSDQQAVAAARQFLVTLFDPSVGMLPEYPGANVYWYYHDNYLAAKVLRSIEPELADRIETSLREANIQRSGKIEILFGEVERPLPFRHPQLVEVRRAGDKVLKTERLTTRPLDDWDQYADLLFFAALAHLPTDQPRAVRLAQQGWNLWDGHGFHDRVVDAVNHYATYKLALALICQRRLDIETDLAEVARDKLLAQQDPSGGFITDYNRSGQRLGQPNVETTSLAILALDQAAT